LHAALRAAATALGVSLNEYCATKLALPIGSLIGAGAARAVVERAAALLGADLVGVVVFGSWARGESGPTSDVDTLIVVDARRSVTRGIYREWDRETLTWDGHAVEPHFVHLPEVDAIGTVWAESAVDGIVLFERDLEVSRRLAAVRREIVAGRLVRRFIHGQPYWAEVA
jgi:hypothetical protein